MPIEELTNEVVTQRCAVCQSVTKVPLTSLTIGVGSQVPDDIDARVLPLPACATCKAQEFLIRSADGQAIPDAGSYAHVHSLLVDQLHAQLSLAGRVDKRLANLKLTELPPEVRKQFFPDGLKALVPVPEKPGL